MSDTPLARAVTPGAETARAVQVTQAAEAGQRRGTPVALPLPLTLAFSDEAAMLREAAAAFCRERSPSATVRARMAAGGGFDAALWDEIAGMGWPGAALPEAQGGSGLGLGGAALIAEAMGRHLMATPFVSTQIAVHGLRALAEGPAGADAAAAAAHWLLRLAQGTPATVALFDDDGHWDLTRPAATAERQGDTVRLQGHKVLVTDAQAAALMLVSVRCDGAPALVLLDAAALRDATRRDAAPSAGGSAAAPGAGRLERETVIDETRATHRLVLDGLLLPASALVTGDPARRALRAIWQAGVLLAAAEAAGGIAGALDVVVDYLNTRVAFGRKIGSYQALKHGAVDILVALERSRSHVLHAATLLDALPPGADDGGAEVALRMAKTEAGEGLAHAGDRAVQFHGGFGFTWDCDAQLYLRRGLWLSAWFGDAMHHRRRLADLLLPRG